MAVERSTTGVERAWRGASWRRLRGAGRARKRRVPLLAGLLLACLVGALTPPRTVVQAAPAAPDVLSTPRLGPFAGPATAEPVRLADTVVLLVIDGIRWQEVFRGVDRKLARTHGMRPASVVDAATLVPALHRLGYERGAVVGVPGVGEPLRASGPVYRSLPGYMELLSGQPAEYCRNNRCGDVRFSTLLDDVAAASDAPLPAALFGSWPHLVHAAAVEPERVVISAGRRGGVNLDAVYDTPLRARYRDEALKAGATPSKGDFRGDPFTAQLALDYLHEKLPRFLFISLGEADAYGHGNNYPAYLRALRRSDAFVGELMRALDELNGQGHRTTLLVTTDHGRDAQAREHGPWAPETGRVWLFAGGFGVPARGAVALPDARVLADIAPSIRRLLGVPSADLAVPTRRGLPELFEPHS